MLPAETFADIVSFLGYYDLGGLKLASKLFSVVAVQCADLTHLFDFSDVAFYVGTNLIHVYRLRASLLSWACQLDFNEEKSMTEFISEAFRNCNVGRLMLCVSHNNVLHAVKAVANTVTVADLHVAVGMFRNVEELVEYVDRFRRVEV